ncbi:MAG: C39 family peptidase [Candidatus Hecatellaceae archaeon]
MRLNSSPFLKPILFLAVLLMAVGMLFAWGGWSTLESKPERLYVDMGCDVSAKFLEVPFVRQKPLYCSEASASMVLQYYGFQVSQDDVHNAGVEAFEDAAMLDFLKRYVEVERRGGLSLEDIKAEIDEGNPVILRIVVGSYRHSIVVVGYDEKYIYIHDPDVGPYLKADPQVLLKFWSKTGRQAILIHGLKR